MEASSPRSGTDRTDRSNYTSSATSGCGTTPSCSASASGGSVRRSAAQTGANSAAGSPRSTAKSYPTPEESIKAYTDYSGTDRSATDRSHSEPYSRSERMSGHSGSQSSEQDAAYSDYSDQYSDSESSGPPSARPAVNLADGVRSFLGSVDEAFTKFAQRNELVETEQPPRPERREGPARGLRGGQRRRGGDGREVETEGRRRVLWLETEGLRGALEENLNSIEMILSEIDEQTRESAAQLSRAEAALAQSEETVARMQTQVDDATSQRERSVAALRDELRVARTKLETRRKGPAAQTAAKRLAEAEAVEAAAMAAQAKLGWRLHEAEAAALTHLGEGAPDLGAIQRQLSILAQRAPHRRAWREPPSRLRPRLELLCAGLPLSLRVDAVGSGVHPELAPRWCALAPARRGVLLVHASVSGDGLQWEPPMELDLALCCRMCLGLPELQLSGLLRHRPLQAAPPPPLTLWASAHLSFSILVAPRDARAATADGTVGGAAVRGGKGQQAEALLELHAVARDRHELLHCYLGLQGLSGMPPAERLTAGGLLWQLLRQLLAARKGKSNIT